MAMKRTLKIILTSLLVSLVVLVIINFIIKEFDIVTYLTGISSFVIAILTVFYVLTTSNQLDVMSNQLIEMKKDRELQNQPLPWLENIFLEIEAPRLYYSPPEKRHSFISRYNVFLDLENLSDCPAISIDISSKLIFKKADNQDVLTSTFERVDTLAGNQKYPKNDKDKKIDFLFPGDNSCDLFTILRDSIETPLLKIDITYRNILGACFLIENEYQLFQHEDDEDIINKWHTDIVSFPTKEKEKIEKLVQLKKSNDSQWDKLFASIKSSYKYKQAKVTLKAYSLSGSFKIKTLSIEDYEERIKNIYYSRRLKSIDRGCITPSA